MTARIIISPYGSQKSRDEYDELVGEWLSKQEVSKVTLTVDHLCLLFLQHAETYFRHKDGTPTSEITSLRYALRPLIKLHGNCRVGDFGSLKLKEVRQSMITAGICRSNINRTIHRIKRAFAWGVENEMVVAPAAMQFTLDA